MRVPMIRNVTVQTSNSSEAWVLDKTQTNPHEAFFYIECVCNAWFTIEILTRFTSAPSKLSFIKGTILSQVFPFNFKFYYIYISFQIYLTHKEKD